MINNNAFVVRQAVDNQDYNICLTTDVSGDSYKLFRDNTLTYNPGTQTLKVNGIKFPGAELSQTGLPKSSFTLLDTPITQSLVASRLADITGLRATIKPSSTASKILIVVRWFGEFGVATDIYNSMWGLNRNGGPIGNPTNLEARSYGMASSTSSYNHAGNIDSTPDMVQYYYIDSPNTTDPVTYQATILVASNQTFFINRTGTDTNSAASYERGTSNIFLMEVS